MADAHVPAVRLCPEQAVAGGQGDGMRRPIVVSCTTLARKAPAASLVQCFWYLARKD